MVNYQYFVIINRPRYDEKILCYLFLFGFYICNHDKIRYYMSTLKNSTHRLMFLLYIDPQKSNRGHKYNYTIIHFVSILFLFIFSYYKKLVHIKLVNYQVNCHASYFYGGMSSFTKLCFFITTFFLFNYFIAFLN